jgi:hypothetical protein
MLQQARIGMDQRATHAVEACRAAARGAVKQGEMTKERMGDVSTQAVTARAKKPGGRRWLR